MRWRSREGLGTIDGMSFDMPDQSPTEQLRQMNNIVRTGRVEAVNPRLARCRIRTGELLTDWLPWLTLAAGGGNQVRHWRVPAIHEECLLLAPGGDLAQAIALPGLFCEDMPQNAGAEDLERHDFSSSDYWEYDRKGGSLVFDIASRIQLKVGASLLTITPEGTTLATPDLLVDSPQSTFSGALTVQGLLSYQSGISGQAGSGNGNTIKGGFAVDGGSITHDGKNIGSTHTHPGDSGGTTGAPN